MAKRYQRVGGSDVDNCDNANSDSWDYLGSGSFSGAFNMSEDRRLFELVRDQAVERPLLRFYRWENPTVSLGVNQIAEEVVNLAELTRHGYELIKRPTGGRALLHKGDLCYAIIARRDWHPKFRTLSLTYRSIASAITLCLQRLGIDVSGVIEPPAREKDTLAPCFTMTSPFEVTAAGRKICGSAQFRSGDSFLQHGSIRVQDNWNQADRQDIWPQGVMVDNAGITSVQRELEKDVAFPEVERTLLAAWEEYFGVDIIVSNSLAVERVDGNR
ncbi:MAG: hypothetical protein KAT58_00775 [candidate division Zixibacteria bacterium]|nr:hypothetical protein [candidate division Zixibacteria bacterium]